MRDVIVRPVAATETVIMARAVATLRYRRDLGVRWGGAFEL